MKLRTRVLVTALLSVSAIITLSFGLTAGHDIVLRRDELTSQVNTIAAIMAQGLVEPMWQEDGRTIHDVIAGLTHHPDFANASVMDENGKVLVSLTRPETVQDGTLAADAAIVMERSGPRRVLGSIEVQLTTRSLWAYGRRQVVTLLGTLLATSLAVGLAISVAFRLLTAPLDRVAAAAARLGRGEHDQPAPEQARHDEIGNIARAIELSRRQMATIERMRRDQDNYLRIVFANAVDGIIVVDAAGRVESFNPGAERIFDRSCGPGVDLHLSSLLPALQWDGLTTSLAAEIDGLRSDGGRIPLSVSVSRFAFGDSSKLSVVVHDISVHKAAERAFVAARQAAEEASATKSAFLANMSHEIRTPMNAIIGFARLALDFELPARLRGHMEKIQTAAQGLLAIINDILDLSKIEAGKLTMEAVSFSLDQLLNEMADMFTLRAHQQRLELLFDVPADLPATLVGDPVRLRQVLVNLVGNAIKFTERGEVVVSALREADSGSGVLIRFMVRDTGIGMTEQQRLRVFDAFTQADVSTTRRHGGTGLGLTISRHIVAMMGGEIGVSSALGRGSTFWFTARFGLPALVAERFGGPAAVLPKGLRVLVVDDNVTSLAILSSLLASLHFDVLTAESGGEALARLETAAATGRVVDVVLMDYLMPGMDGIEATRRIKRLDGLRQPPTVVMVTAQDRDDIAQRAWSAGIDAFLIKPVTSSQLLDTIQQVLGGGVTVHRRPPPEATDPTSISVARARLSGARLLLVEDNDINRDLALEVLARSSLRADTAADGAEAIRMIRAGDYDAVLMDCQMPVMDGYTATRILREDPRFDTLPIIAMTANAMAGDREECLAAGMTDYIAKPFDEPDLLAILAQWIRPGPSRLPHDVPATAPPMVAAPHLAGLTRVEAAEGLRYAGGDVALYRRLLERFAGQQARFEETFGAALADGDNEQAVRLAHTLKGLSASLGARRLAATAAGLEQALREAAEPVQLESRLAEVLAELAAVLAELERSQAPDPEGAAHDAALSDALAPPEEVAALAAMLNAGEVESIDYLSALLARWPGMAGRLEAVRRLAVDYRFEEAAAELALATAEA